LKRYRETVVFEVGGHLFVELSETLDGTNKRFEDLTAAKAVRAAIDTELDNVRHQHTLIARDLGDLLGLLSVYSVEPDAPFAAYQAGVLKDLPKLRGLEDGLEDLETLRVKLEKLGGGVRVSAADAHAAFTAKIDELRDTSLALISREHAFGQQRK